MGTGEEVLGIQLLDTSELSATSLPATGTDWVGREEGAKVQSQKPMNQHGNSGKAVNEGIPHAGSDGARLGFIQLEDTLHHR